MAYRYFPVFRARQQELDVLANFDFGDSIVPIVEIIKEKDRKDNKSSSRDIYSEIFQKIDAQKFVVDQPIYLRPTLSTAAEVRSFYLSTISVLDRRIEFYNQFTHLKQKVIPAISSLKPVSSQPNTLIEQFDALSGNFPQLAIRIFFNGFDDAFGELQQLQLRPEDIIIYDLDTANITNPLVMKHKKNLYQIFPDIFKVVLRSAINTDIQNVSLDHEEVISQADNSLRDLFKNPPYGFSAFGDYAGVKKDDITAGGGVSPGLVFYNPDENVYYGYKGATKDLYEFERTIIPAVLDSGFVQEWERTNSAFIQNNPGIDRLKRIANGQEPSRSQAKYKWVSMMHYLHCIRVMIIEGAI